LPINKRAVLVTFFDKKINRIIWEQFIKESFIIAVDSGADLLCEIGITPDLMIGDFDSISQEAYHEFDKVEKLVYQPEKDFTDTELALDWCFQNNYNEIIIINSMSGRPDQIYGLVAHMQLAKIKNVDLIISDTENHMFCVRETEKIIIDQNSILSLIPLSESVNVVSTNGLQYPLSKELLFSYKNRGISNITTADEVVIKIDHGDLLAVVESKNKFLRK
jgi:thiamine pyrophosphokinase